MKRLFRLDVLLIAVVSLVRETFQWMFQAA
jgi:hypothetical protein